MRKLFFGLIVLVSLFNIMSCSKTDEPNTNQKSLSEKPILLNPTPISQYGISHNLRMDFISSHSDFQNLSLEEVFNYGKNYSDAYFSYTSLTDYENHQSRRLFCFTLIENPSTAGIILYNSSLIPNNLIGLVDTLSSILDNAMDYETGVYKSVSEFTTEIENFESYVNSNYNVIYDEDLKIGNEYAFILCAASIAKNSYSYWLDAATNPDHSWFERLDQVTYNGGIEDSKVPEWLKKVWHGVKVAAVDTWGFITAEPCFTPTYGYNEFNERVVTGGSYDLGCAWDYAGDQSSNVP